MLRAECMHVLHSRKNEIQYSNDMSLNKTWSIATRWRSTTIFSNRSGRSDPHWPAPYLRYNGCVSQTVRYTAFHAPEASLSFKVGYSLGHIFSLSLSLMSGSVALITSVEIWFNRYKRVWVWDRTHQKSMLSTLAVHFPSWFENENFLIRAS